MINQQQYDALVPYGDEIAAMIKRLSEDQALNFGNKLKWGLLLCEALDNLTSMTQYYLKSVLEITTTMKRTKRSLSGIYLKFNHPETGMENRVFEDLPLEDQQRWLDSLDTEALKRTCIALGETIREIGDEFGLTKEPPNNVG